MMTTEAIRSRPVSRRVTAGDAIVGWRPAVPLAMDAAALAGAYTAHREATYTLAYRILGDGSAADDAVQDAFIKLWVGTAQFDPARGSMRGLLLTIARHTSIDVIRKRARRQRTESTYCAGETYTSEGPEQATERAEDTRNVRGALARLPAGQRSAIEKAYFSGLTRRQIAAEMALPIGTVKSRMRLGMRTLASVLAEGAMPARLQAETRRTPERRRRSRTATRTPVVAA